MNSNLKCLKCGKEISAHEYYLDGLCDDCRKKFDPIVSRPNGATARKHLIQVKSNGVTIKHIERKIYGFMVGNFNPMVCRFDGKTYLVKSEIGDLSDPFRREENYLNYLFIEMDKPCQWNL